MLIWLNAKKRRILKNSGYINITNGKKLLRIIDRSKIVVNKKYK